MASTINVLTTGVGGVQTTGDTSGILQMQTNGTATLTIDTSGNVGIGTATPSFTSAGRVVLSINGSTDSVWTLNYGGTAGLYAQASATDGKLYTTGSLPLLLGTGSAERLRIGTTGEIGLGGANYGTSGQFLKSNGPGAAATWGTAGGGFSNMTVFTSPGTFTTPASTTQIKVTVVGGGGGSFGSPTGSIGSGGGGGGTAIYVGPVSASTGYAVTVGAGGPAPGTGGTSSFGVLASATGGSGGGPSSGVGGAGGAGSAGTLQIAGGGGGGGGSGAASIAGVGGSSYLGGGGAGGPGTNPGRSYGGGGASGNSGANVGGTGAGGVVVVEY